MTKAPEWSLASGDCGYRGVNNVYGAYVNGVALFAFQRDSGSATPFYSCVVTGALSCGGATLEEVQAKGVAYARDVSKNDLDRRLSKKQFDEIMRTPRETQS